MANDDYLEMLSLLGTSGSSWILPEAAFRAHHVGGGMIWHLATDELKKEKIVTPIENPPFFITVKPSEKGKKAGVEERADGLYLGDVKIADREILVREGA